MYPRMERCIVGWYLKPRPKCWYCKAEFFGCIRDGKEKLWPNIQNYAQNSDGELEPMLTNVIRKGVKYTFENREWLSAGLGPGS